MAKKDVSVIVSALGVLMSIITNLVSLVRKRGGTDEDIYRLATPEGESLLEKIADLIVVAGRFAGKVYRITIGDGRTTEDLVRDGKYDYANTYVTSVNFSLRPQFMGPREVVLLEFDHDVSSEEAIAEAAKQDLEQPVYEDALRFGVEYPEVQRERPVVFLHEPVRDPSGDLSVLYLWGSAGDRRLNLDWFVFRWYRRYRFAFVRKSK